MKMIELLPLKGFRIPSPDLQIRGDTEDNSKIFFLTSQQKHVVTPR